MLREATAESPAEGVRLAPVPECDEGHDALDHLDGSGEIAVLENPPLEDAKPDFDLVDPRGVERRVDEMEAATVATVEAAPCLGASSCCWQLRAWSSCWDIWFRCSGRRLPSKAR